jgi:hypothetical protein
VMRKIAYAAPALLIAALAALLSGWSGANNATPTPTPTPTPASNPGCDFFASPTGSDSNAGTSPANAFRTVSKLNSVLSAGTIGCLESGDYGSSSTMLQLLTVGVAGNPATITADTGAHPVIQDLREQPHAQLHQVG